VIGRPGARCGFGGLLLYVWVLVLGGCGGCGLLVGFKSSLRLRRALRRIRWVAQFGGAPQVALAAGGCACARPRAGPSHCAHVWSGGWRPRLVGAWKSKTGPPAAPARRAPSLRGWGVALCAAGRCLWLPVSRVPRRVVAWQWWWSAWWCGVGLTRRLT